MAGKSVVFDWKWDVDKYKSVYDPEYWELCRTFMVIHKTKYPEQKLVHLTEAFYQIGVYGSSYDAKTTRMVSALSVEVLDDFLKLHPGAMRHPFDKTAVVTEGVVAGTSADSSKKGSSSSKTDKPTSIWDVAVDKTILVNILVLPQLKALFKGFVIIYDIRRTSAMNDNKIAILEDSFKRSKFGALHWEKTETNNFVCPIRLILKWKSVVLAEAEGSDEKALRIRIAQAILSKMASFSPAIEAKWSYYRDGRVPDVFEFPNARRVNIYKILRRSQFSAMAEITSFIDTFANSDSYAEIVFGMDFNSSDKKQITDYVMKSWGTKLTYRTVNKSGVKSKGETHICVYHIRTGDELRRWLEQNNKENERYRLIGPGEHRRAGSCDKNVREMLTTTTVSVPAEEAQPTVDSAKKDNIKVAEKTTKKEVEVTKPSTEVGKNEAKPVKKDEPKEKSVKKSEEGNEDDLEKLLDGFVLFYDANKDSKIDKDDWFTALCNSFEISKFGPLEIINESIRPLRTKCTFKWKNMILASAEGLTETQAKTGATLQLISKLEPFTYIIQAREDYFCDGKIPQFVIDPDPEVYRVVSRNDLPSYYSIFQTIDEFTNTHSFSEIVFGKDFTWELKNEILVYLKAKELDYRFFTTDDEKPPTHLAVYHKIKPDVLKKHLLEKGGENEKYKLIPPPKAELGSDTTNEAPKPKEKEPEKKAESIQKTKVELSSKSVENSTSKPADKSTSKSAEKPPSKPAEKPSSKPAEKPPSKPAEKPSSKAAEKPPSKAPEKPPLKSSEKPPSKPVEKPPSKLIDKASLAKLAEKRKEPEEPPVLELETNKIMINLKKFKKDKVEYPEDTGGDFPGLILWVGIKKNSTWQRNLFWIVQDSFKMSKYGELTVEESEENVWSRKEPLKKCVIKANRKVIGVGLGESKTEAKNLAAQQVCRQLRKHCYTIQAKESYFKEGKATPYDFNPDPAKSHVYSVLKRDTFKNQAAIIKYVDDFSKKVKGGEVIFGEDFSYDEREAVLDYCRKINLSYRLIKCHSAGKNIHTHITIFHQRPLPTLKADLMRSGGENDMFRLIPPGGKVTIQNSDKDLWPDTLEGGNNEELGDVKSTIDAGNKDSSHSLPTEIINKTLSNSENLLNSKAVLSNKLGNVNNNTTQNLDKEKSTTKGQLNTSDSIDEQSKTVGPELLKVLPTEDQPLNFGPQLQPANFVQSYPQAGPTMLNSSDPTVAGVPFGYQPFSVPSLAFQEMPLVFGPQPPPVIYMPVQPVDMSVLPSNSPKKEPEEVSKTTNASKKTDLREELAKKRQAESKKKRTPDRKVYDMTPERSVINKDNSKAGWSRKVFVSDTENGKAKPDDLREKLRNKDLSKEKRQKWSQEKDFSPGRSRKISQERNLRRVSPNRDHRRMSPERRRFSPGGPRRFSPGPRRLSPGPRRFSPERNLRYSLERDYRRMSPERGRSRNIPREESWSQDERIVRHRNPSYERRFPRDISRDSYSRDRRSFSRSPRRSLSPFREERFRRSPSPQRHGSSLNCRRDLWDNISALYSETIFMYKYVKQDSTTETDPIALLRATRSLEFNIDFEFISHQISIDRWQVEVELVTDNSIMHPLVGEGVASTEGEARLLAAHHAVDTIQKACRVIEPNYNYFVEGGTPLFIIRRNPTKTYVYEIIQNMDPSKPLDMYTVDVMLKVFMQSELEDIFFLSSDFSYFERALVIDVANKMGLWWRLFGPRHQSAGIDDIVSTQHVCVSKQKSALQLVRELLAKGGSTERYTLVDPRESRITRPRSPRY